MTASQIVFVLLALVTLTGALGVLLSVQVVRSAFLLVLAFVGMAGLYFQLHADFVAAVQIMVYAGAVTVIMLFAVMLTPGRADSIYQRSQSRWWVVGITVAVILIALLKSVALVPSTAPSPAPLSTVHPIGFLLYRVYLLPFETIALVLIAALIGAILLTKKEAGR